MIAGPDTEEEVRNLVLGQNRKWAGGSKIVAQPRFFNLLL